MNELYLRQRQLKRNIKKNEQQRGLSLIELLVTLLIASFFILGLTSLFVDNIKTAQVTQGLGVSTESGGFGTLLLSRYLRLAGHENYFRQRKQGDEEFINKVNVDKLSNNIGTGGNFDVAAIEYQAPETGTGVYTACAGLEIDAGRRVLEVFKVDADNNLMCTSTDVLNPDDTEDSVLVKGVEMFQVQYGMADNFSTPDVSSYVNGDKLINQVSVNEQVRAIRFQLLVSSEEDSLEASNKTYDLYDASTTAKGASYRVYGSTIVMNNASRGRIIK